jgi:hypothetical protein
MAVRDLDHREKSSHHQGNQTSKVLALTSTRSRRRRPYRRTPLGWTKDGRPDQLVNGGHAAHRGVGLELLCWLNSNKGTKCDIEISDSRALFREFKCAASESWTPLASLSLGLPAGTIALNSDLMNPSG